MDFNLRFHPEITIFDFWLFSLDFMLNVNRFIFEGVNACSWSCENKMDTREIYSEFMIIKLLQSSHHCMHTVGTGPLACGHLICLLVHLVWHSTGLD